jgi:hypothetical protein
VSDKLWNFCLYTLQTPEDSNQPNYDHIRTERLRSCSDKLKQWSTAFEAFIDTSKNNLDPKGRQAANVMRINELIAEISLAMISEDETDETIWASHDKDFAAILFLATEIIDSSADSSLASDTARFSLDTCVVGPLYFVAMRCRHKILRAKAISLLRLSPRVEGLWDSRLVAEIAEGVQGIEERKSEAGHSNEADCVRVTDVDVEFDRDGRRAAVRYIGQGGAMAVMEEAGKDEMAW